MAYPEKWGLRPIPPLESGDLLAADPPVERPLFFEHETTRAAVVGDWKLVSGGHERPWELYHLPTDPFELNDRADAEPARVRDLEAAWNHWAQTHDVLPLNPAKWAERTRQ